MSYDIDAILRAARPRLDKLRQDVADVSKHLEHCALEHDAAAKARKEMEARGVMDEAIVAEATRCDEQILEGLNAQRDALEALERELEAVRKSIPDEAKDNLFEAELQLYRDRGQSPRDVSGVKH